MKKTLVILAAGMGSRFGGPKQFYPVGDNGEFIMDYSIYSAIRYGFTKVVFVIRKEFEDELNNTVIKRINRYIDCSYVFQEISNLPKGLKVPKERTKPLGTAHAMYCARNEVVGNVAVISADDFYGDEAFKDLSESLDRKEYGVLSFKISETMSSHGIVKRGVKKSRRVKGLSVDFQSRLKASGVDGYFAVKENLHLTLAFMTASGSFRILQ